MRSVEDFLIARNPEDGSSLPYLVRLPLGPEGIVLKVRDTWPRTAKVYAHEAPSGWPSDPEVVERVPVRACVRRGASIDLVLARGRENRSQFVFARARGREVIFWQSARTARQARPGVALPTMRAAGQVLEVLVDSHERYPWRFTAQQATTQRRAIVFCETRPLAQEWTYRFLGAAAARARAEGAAGDRLAALPPAGPVPPATASAREVRAWARAAGLEVGAAGRRPPAVRTAYDAAHRDG